MNDKKRNIIESTEKNDFSKKPPIIKKNPQNNVQINALKNMISSASNEIQKIEIKPLKIEPVNQTGGILGFDFRGSINIKKNMLSR